MLSEWRVRHIIWSIGTYTPVNGSSSHCLHTYIDLLDLNVLVPNCCHLPVVRTYYLCDMYIFVVVVGKLVIVVIFQ